MLNKFLLFVLLFTSFSSFAQEAKRCNKGSLSFGKNGIFNSPTLVKDGFIMNTETIQKLFCISRISDQFRIQALGESNLSITHLGTDSKLNVSVDMLDTKASLMLCVEEFTDKLTFFFLNGEEEVIFNSTNGIPFLTFTKITD